MRQSVPDTKIERKRDMRKWMAVLLAGILGLFPATGLAEGITAYKYIDAYDDAITIDDKEIENNTIEAVNINDYNKEPIKILSYTKDTTLIIKKGVRIKTRGDYGMWMLAQYGFASSILAGQDIFLNGSMNYGVQLEAFENSSVNFDVKGNVTAKASIYTNEFKAVRIQVYNGNGVKVKANIAGTLKSEGKNATGLSIFERVDQPSEEGSEVSVTIGGGIIADCNGIEINSDSQEKEFDLRYSIVVTGDVTAKEGYGLSVNTPYASTVVIDGTLSGGQGAVQTSEKVSENLTLAAWKIDPKNGAYAVGGDGKRNEDAEKNLYYIIRVNQPEEGGTLYTENTADIAGYDCAKAGDTVYLLGNLEKGYEMLAAFWDENLTQKMTVGGKNRFCMLVPAGGGVTLSAILRKPVHVKPQSVRPDYHVTYREAESFDTWIPVE